MAGTPEVFVQEFSVLGGDFNRAGSVSVTMKKMLQQIGFDADLVRRASISVFEAEMNVVMYAREAHVRVEVTPEKIFVVFDDKGQGIPDIEQAMQEGFTTSTPEMREMGFGSGLGLPNIKRNADHLNITSQVGRGTRVEITLYSGNRDP